MKYFVTGGAGFIGSNLVETLAKQGNEIIVMDNLHTGSLDNLKNVKAEIHVAPCSEAFSLKNLKNLDGIYHLGMPSSSPMYKKDPLLAGKAIAEFITMLELAKREGCKMVYASSSSIYNGNPTPWKEDMPVFVTDFYTEARYAMERLAKLYSDLYGVKSIGMRFFSVYGPHEEAKKSYANLVTQFAWAMKKGEQPVIFGDGSQKRDFTFVLDIVNACMTAMKSNTDHGIFNAGTGKAYSLNEIVEILNQMLETDITAKYVKNDIKNYVQDTLADTSKAEKGLGFKARYSLEDGLKQYILN
jgi:UDP-glucose 4-epimerase